MSKSPAVATPFAISQGSSQLSADAPEFVTGLGRSRTNSLHKAKDSVSSMTETEAEVTKAGLNSGPDSPEIRENGTARETASSSSPPPAHHDGSNGRQQHDQEFPVPVRLTKAQTNNTSPAQGASRLENSGAKANHIRQPRATPFSPAGSSSSSSGQQRRPPGGRSPPHLPYHDPYTGLGGQQMMMNNGPPGAFYPPTPYNQMYGAMPITMGMQPRDGQLYQPPQLMYPSPGPYMLPPNQWPPHGGLPPYPMMPMLTPDQYPPRGFPPSLGLHGGFYSGYEEPSFGQHMGGEPQWRPPMVLDNHAGFQQGISQRGLNAAATGWNPNERALIGQQFGQRAQTANASAAAQLGRSSAENSAEHTRLPGAEQPGHRRQTSASSSERKKGHRRMVSVPVNFTAATEENVEPIAEEPLQEKPAPPRRRGHRRQSSLPTASDMERLKEGGRRGRHSRSDSWASNARSSAVLEEFKASRDTDRQWTLADVKGHVIEFCKDQAGSRFIQQALEDEDTLPEQICEVALETKPRFSSLMEDVFGNYVIQKLLERAASPEKAWMAERICQDGLKPSQPNRAVALSRHQYGCRVVQKALETLDLEDKKSIMEQLLGNTLDLVADQNGNHVIQKCIECIKPTVHIEPLINELLSGKESRTIPTLRGAVVPLSQHTYGCRVVQRVLEHCDERRFKERFMTEILKDVLQLSRNIYSNYVIQHVLEYGEPHEKEKVMQDLAPHVIDLSRDKFASNVVERCLKHGSLLQRHLIVQEFLRHDAALVAMMKDDYGNYVCYSAFEYAEEDQKQQLAEVIKRSMGSVRRTSFGKNFHSKLAEHHPNYFGGADFGIHNSLRGPLARPPAQQIRPRGQPGPGRGLAATAALVPASPQLRDPKQTAAASASPAQLPSAGNATASTQPKGGDDSPVLTKAEDTGKYLSGQVSVTADGVNPPVHPPVTIEQAASNRDDARADEVADSPSSRTASQEVSAAPVSSSPAPISIEG